VLLNRNYEIVDRIRKTVFKEEEYKGRPVGTATIFQGDVRISTNVRNLDGTRAIGTQASAEVTTQSSTAVPPGGTRVRGQRLVPLGLLPIHDLDGKTIGMLYVGVLERPYTDTLLRTLLIFLGIAAGGVALVHLVAMRVARRISGPIHDMAAAAQLVADGDFSHKVAVSSTDELGYLAERFNTMTAELERATLLMRESADELERKVEQRTAELRAMQSHLIQSEKMAASASCRRAWPTKSTTAHRHPDQQQPDARGPPRGPPLARGRPDHRQRDAALPEDCEGLLDFADRPSRSGPCSR